MNEMLVRNGNTNGTTRAPSQTQGHVWFTPRFDVYEDASEYVLTGDLPGVAPEGLEVTFENGELSIYGQVQPRYDECRCFAGEYGIGDYRRTFSIGELIDGENISAELKNGVLTVHLPKRPEAKPRKIEVRTA
jgi:HSP20 family molecular chaperone IbpA